MANVTIHTIPIGSQYYDTTVGGDADKNDFKILLVWNENVTGLTLSDFTLSKGSIQSLEGENSVYALVIRPAAPLAVNNNVRVYSELITLTLSANAVTEGNSLTTKTIRISSVFPDDDADSGTLTNITPAVSGRGLAISENRFYTFDSGTRRFHAWTKDWVEQTAENFTFPSDPSKHIASNSLYFFNDTLCVGPRRWTLDGTEIESLHADTSLPILITEHGLLYYAFTKYNLETWAGEYIALNGFSNENQGLLPAGRSIEGDSLYQTRGRVIVRRDGVGNIIRDGNGYALTDSYYFLERRVFDFSKKTVEIANILNIQNNDAATPPGNNSRLSGYAVYKDSLYILYNTPSKVREFDLKKYRPMAKNTKTTIYPVFAKPGETIDLKQYAPDAERITFDVGYRRPSYLSINANHQLIIASNAVTETSPVFVALKAINHIDATEDRQFRILSDYPSGYCTRLA